MSDGRLEGTNKKKEKSKGARVGPMRKRRRVNSAHREPIGIKQGI
jgi:hypothetical protein